VTSLNSRAVDRQTPFIAFNTSQIQGQLPVRPPSCRGNIWVRRQPSDRRPLATVTCCSCPTSPVQQSATTPRIWFLGVHHRRLLVTDPRRLRDFLEWIRPVNHPLTRNKIERKKDINQSINHFYYQAAWPIENETYIHTQANTHRHKHIKGSKRKEN